LSIEREAFEQHKLAWQVENQKFRDQTVAKLEGMVEVATGTMRTSFNALADQNVGLIQANLLLNQRLLRCTCHNDP